MVYFRARPRNAPSGGLRPTVLADGTRMGV